MAPFPRSSLGHFPTPLEPMERLTATLRRSGPAPNLWIKRDDCTGLATGGNKTRKLEYLVADALQRGADTLITSGAIQSNHVRQTAAAAARTGLACAVVLEHAVDRDDDYTGSGNILLDGLFGAEIVDRLPAGSDMEMAAQEVAAVYRARGNTPYVIPIGGSNAIGSLGYVDCAAELAQHEIDITSVVLGTGSAGTQAGLLAGLRSLGSDTDVLGVCVSRTEEAQRKLVHELTVEVLELLGSTDGLPAERVRADDRFVGDGYGIPTAAMVDAVTLVARTEGILLDPVYTGKAMAGLLGNIAEGKFGPDDNVVFLHTGGSAGLFGYRSVFA
ncbi:D-cysteine desulfhydrase [Streptomyces antnestii]|uniref:D-cysteine desulfhydrase n=1 Tax=Streptomyces antnestii TaxID=2494256 RepID=A0A437NYM4_9ACTN|nr:D-cysteine desulfhydrase [Streptomyces sp. San01]RVU15115.1 D-cysteine desulfhydrase [Streptomyces sp. San01]